MGFRGKAGEGYDAKEEEYTRDAAELRAFRIVPGPDRKGRTQGSRVSRETAVLG